MQDDRDVGAKLDGESPNYVPRKKKKREQNKELTMKRKVPFNNVGELKEVFWQLSYLKTRPGQVERICAFRGYISVEHV